MRLTPRVPVVTKTEAPMTPRGGQRQLLHPIAEIPAEELPRVAMRAEDMIAAVASDPAALAYLTKKLCNLTVLLQRDTMNTDSAYPRFMVAR